MNKSMLSLSLLTALTLMGNADAFRSTPQTAEEFRAIDPEPTHYRVAQKSPAKQPVAVGTAGTVQTVQPAQTIQPTQPLPTDQVSAAQETKPSLKTRLFTKTVQIKDWIKTKATCAKAWSLAKAVCIKNWAVLHKKPLLIGAGIVLTVAAAYLISYLMHSGTQVSGDETYLKLLNDAKTCAAHMSTPRVRGNYVTGLSEIDACFNNVYKYVVKNNWAELRENVLDATETAKTPWRNIFD